LAGIGEPVLGIDFAPLSRADLVWVDENRTSGTGVGEWDGLLRGSLRPWGGWRGEHWDALGSVGVAAISTTTRTEGTSRLQVLGGLRLGVDFQRHIAATSLDPWAGVGAYGVIPLALDSSDSFSEAEAENAAAETAVDRARIGGFGARFGGGVGIPVGEALTLGAASHLVWHGAVSFTDAGSNFSTLTWMETVLRADVVLR
jgi:hypothetical protein